jgi:4-hydroxybenzoate polyprenyltransferase
MMANSTGEGRGEGTGTGLVFLVHCLLPVAAGWSLAQVVAGASGAEPTGAGLAALLGGIAAAYALDRMVDGDGRARWVSLALGLVAAGGAGVALVALALGSTSLGAWVSAGALGLLSASYPLIKRLPTAKTLVVAAAWTWACSTLPFLGSTEGRGAVATSGVVFLAVAAGCILCDIKDRDRDAEGGVPSLAARFGVRTACGVAGAIALLAAALAQAQHGPGLATGSVLLAGASRFPALLVKRPLGAMVVDGILVLPGILFALGMG